jgi:hypothetical protein
MLSVGDEEPDWGALGLVVTGTKGNGQQVIVQPQGIDENGYTISGFDSSSPKTCVLTVSAPGWNGISKGTQEAEFYVSIVSRYGLLMLYSIENFMTLEGSVIAGVALAQENDIVDLALSPAAGRVLSPGSLRYIPDTNDNGSFDDEGESVAIAGASFVMPPHDVKIVAEFVPILISEAILAKGRSVTFGSMRYLIVRRGGMPAVMSKMMRQ